MSIAQAFTWNVVAGLLEKEVEPLFHEDSYGYRRKDGSFTNWLPAVSNKAMKSMREKMKEWNTLRIAWCEIEDLAREINPVVRGWINYYGKFYQTKLKSFMREINLKIAKWARDKYKKVRPSELKAIKWLKGLSQRSPNLFTHWTIGVLPTVE